MSRHAEPQDYCGCCGNPCGPGRMWCVRCTRTVGHLGPADRPAWDRTHQATHGEPCPFQVGRVSVYADDWRTTPGVAIVTDEQGE